MPSRHKIFSNTRTQRESCTRSAQQYGSTKPANRKVYIIYYFLLQVWHHMLILYILLISWLWAMCCPKHVGTEHKWNIYLLTASGWCFSFKSLYDARKNITKKKVLLFWVWLCSCIFCAVLYCHLWLYHAFPRNLISGTNFGNVTERKMRVFAFLYIFEVFLILRRFQRDGNINVQRSLYKWPFILIRF